MTLYAINTDINALKQTFVPYTGATSDVDLGSHSLTASVIHTADIQFSPFSGVLEEQSNGYLIYHPQQDIDPIMGLVSYADAGNSAVFGYRGGAGAFLQYGYNFDSFRIEAYGGGLGKLEVSNLKASSNDYVIASFLNVPSGTQIDLVSSDESLGAGYAASVGSYGSGGGVPQFKYGSSDAEWGDIIYADLSRITTIPGAFYQTGGNTILRNSEGYDFFSITGDYFITGNASIKIGDYNFNNAGYYLDFNLMSGDLTYNGVLTAYAITSQNNILLPDGSDTSPAFTFSNESNTGMFRDAANDLAWSVAGNRRLDLSTTTLTMKGAGTTTNTAFRTTDSTGTVKFSVLDNGKVGIAGFATTASLTTYGTASNITSIFRQNATGTSNITEWQNSIGSALGWVDYLGKGHFAELYAMNDQFSILNGGANVSINFTNGTAGSGMFFNAVQTTGSKIQFNAGTGAGTTQLTLNSDGAGATAISGAKFTCASQWEFTASGANGSLKWLNGTAGGRMNFTAQASSTQRMAFNMTGGAVFLDENARMYIGSTTVASARLHLTAGSATAGFAPLKFTSGTLLTTAEAGAVEFLTDKFYATITTGAARKEITLNDAALTSGRLPYVTTNGRLADDSKLTYNSTTGALGISGTDISTGAPASVDAIAKLGLDIATITPAATTSAGIYTGRMRKVIASSVNGAWTGSSHAVAGFDYMTIAGGNNFQQMFGHEVRIENGSTGTINEMELYKPVLATNSGTITTLRVLGIPDISALTGITNAYIFNNTNSNMKATTSGIVELSGGDQEVIPRDRAAIVTGRYYPIEGVNALFANVALTRNVMWAVPFVCSKKTTFTKIGATVGTAIASSSLRFGIYKDNNGVPDVRILDAGTVSSATTGDKEVTISQSLDAGIYWLVVAMQGGASDGNITWAGVNSWNAMGMSSSTAQDGTYFIAAAGTLPANFGSGAFAGSGFAPFIWMRK